jgi:hypothetical protein
LSKKGEQARNFQGLVALVPAGDGPFMNR